MPTPNSLLNYYDASFAGAANAYGRRLESLSRSEKAQLIMVIGDWVNHCAESEEDCWNSFYEHIAMTDPFDMYDCDAVTMVEKFLDFAEPGQALLLAIALSWQILEGVYSLDEDGDGDDGDELDLDELLGEDE